MKLYDDVKQVKGVRDLGEAYAKAATQPNIEMTDKIILTDADGVLFNWNKAFNNFMAEIGYVAIPEEVDNYSVQARYGIESDLKMDLIKEFNHSDRIGRLEPYADSQEYVTKLNSEGYKFICITSLSEKPSAYDQRAINLRNVFGDAIIGLHCLRIGVHKAEKLQQWKDTGLFWIEDHVANGVAGAKIGLRSIIINHPYNINYTDDDHLHYARVSQENPWAEIYQHIKEAE